MPFTEHTGTYPEEVNAVEQKHVCTRAYAEASAREQEGRFAQYGRGMESSFSR